MDATTSITVAKAQLDDDRRWASEAGRPRRPATHNRPLRRGRWTGRLGALATVVAACALFASVPAMAGAPAATDGQPRPMPAPAPVAMADFPEHARVDAACSAILSRSSAVDNARSPRAAAITSVLLTDACFGA